MSDIKAIQTYLKSDAVVNRFEEIIGKGQAMAYITSVLLAVANNPKLQLCTPESIYTSAIRAATLRLSCDEGTKQSYLVPYKDQCKLIVGYKGLYDMAVRTNKYRYINVGPIYEGEVVVEDRITGFHHIEGAKTGDEIIGYIGAFELYEGYGKTFYMTIEEIHEHAKKYSKSYSFKDAPWTTATEQMERKTVLRRMLSLWGYLDPIDAQLLHSIEENGDNGYVEAPVVVDAEPQEPEEKRTPEDIISDLGYDQFEDEPEEPEEDTDESPYSDLDFLAEQDPSTAFWQLQKRTGTSRADANAIVKETKKDMVAAYQALRKQAPPMLATG